MRGSIDGELLYVLHSGTRSEPLYVLHSGTRSEPLFDIETGEPLGHERDGVFYPDTDDTSWQALSTYNLQTGATELLWYMLANDPAIDWNNNPYPDAKDIVAVDGEIILISNETDRVYRWDPGGRRMAPVMELAEAGRLLAGQPRQ